MAKGMSKATDFVLSGGSAGGLSTFLHADRVAARLRAEAPACKKIRAAPIVDPLSGHRFDVMRQCVAVDVKGTLSLPSADARGLSKWLAGQHAARVKGGACEAPCAALLTAPELYAPGEPPAPESA